MSEEIIAPKEKKKISKGKIILILVLVVILAAGATAGVLFFKHYNSPTEQLKRAEEAGDEAQIEEIMEEYGEVLATEPDVADIYNAKLDELQRSFLEETIEYNAAMNELDRIQAKGITGTLEKSASVRSYISALHASRTAYNTAESFYSTENYAEAIEQYEKVIEDDPNYSNASAKIDSCYNKYREKALAEAEAMVASGSYESAIGLLESALNVLPEDSKINEKIILYKSKLSEMEISDALAKGADYAAAGDYANAIRAIESHYKADPTHYQLSTRYGEYSKAYEDQVIAAADSLAGERKYDEAIEQLKSAQSLLPDSQILKDKIAALEASKPISLSSLGFFNGEWDWNEDTPEDPFGNSYSGSTNFTIQSDHDKYGDPRTVSVEYHVEGKYTTLTGNMVPYTSIHENATFQVLVYTDDGSGNFTLVYTSPEIGRKTYSTPFEANITGARFVKISLVLGDESAAILYNLELWPN